MNILALHGFLGEGTDWNPLMDLLPPALKWQMPSLFSPASELSLSSFEAFASDIEKLPLQSPRYLMGYSMGGRLALDVFKRDPDSWDGLVLMSAHPGLKGEKEISARAEQVKVWLERFRNWNWKELMQAWNSQPVLNNSAPLVLNEERFDREKLCAALENLSVDRQSFDPLFLKQHRQKIWCLVGERDEKYVEIYSELKNRGAIENLTILKGLGHRILHDGVELMAPRLEGIFDL